MNALLKPNPEDKLCKECKHYQLGWPPNLGSAFSNSEFVRHYCMRKVMPDLVTGGILRSTALDCYEERKATGLGCGKQGLYYEPKSNQLPSPADGDCHG